MLIHANPNELDADDFLHLGLDIAGFKNHRRHSYLKNITRYTSEYGSKPIVHATLFSDLKKLRQAQGNPNGGEIEGIDQNANPSHFLWACCWLKNYHNLVQMAGKFGRTEATCSKWIWFYVNKINELFGSKIVWR